MALQVTVYKDIEKYEEKAYFDLTARQCICLCPSVLVALIFGFLNYYHFHLSQNLATTVYFFILAPPLLIGFVRPKGFPIEKYFKYVFNYYFKTAFRPFHTENILTSINKKKKKKKKEVEYED